MRALPKQKTDMQSLSRPICKFGEAELLRSTTIQFLQGVKLQRGASYDWNKLFLLHLSAVIIEIRNKQITHSKFL